LQLTNAVSKTSKTKVVVIFSGMNYVVKGRHSNWSIAKKGFELSGTTATTTRLQVSKALVHKYTQMGWDAFANAQSLAIPPTSPNPIMSKKNCHCPIDDDDDDGLAKCK
jgi:hypothetical protein